MLDYLETGTFLALNAVAKEPERWSLDNLYRVPRNAITSTAGPSAFVLPAGQRDMYAVYDMLKVLEQSRVEIHRATAPFTAGGKEYPPARSSSTRGSRSASGPSRSWATARTRTAKNCATCPLLMPYSEATDNLPLMLGITADPIAAAVSAPLERVAAVTPAAVLMPQPPAAAGAYLVEPSSYGVARFLADLQKADVPVFRSSVDVHRGAGVRARHARRAAVGAGAARLGGGLKETGLPVFATDAAPEGRGLPAQAGHQGRPDPRREQHAGRLADVAARPA